MITGETSLTKVTIGFQLGGQVFSQMVFFEDKLQTEAVGRESAGDETAKGILD